MKKIIAMLLVLVMALAMVACNTATQTPTTTAGAANDTTAAADDTTAAADDTTAAAEDTTAPAEATVMTHDEYMAAEMDSEVTVEFYVQGAQNWWFDSDAGYGKITVYGQDDLGGYFGYELKCTEEDAAKVVPGAKIRVTGYKGEWAGEVEIMDGSFVFVDAESFIAEPMDVTEQLGTEELIQYQNMKVAFKGLTVKGIAYKNDEPGDDIYVTVTKDDAEYSFCVEMYLTGPDTDVYKAVGELKEGDVIDVEGFLYWYEGVNTHITAVTAAA